MISSDRPPTWAGKAFVGTRAVFRGHDQHADLGRADWMDLFVFGITGRRYGPAALKLMHALWVGTSYADVRLWNNRVAGLAASARSTPSLAVAAALGMCEATVYGGHPCVRAIDFLLSARQRLAQGEALESLVATELAERRIYGYGRPIHATDERLPWLQEIAREQGLADGPHLALARQVEAQLCARDPRLKMNYAAMAAALAADLGFSVVEFHHFQVPMAMAGIPPCAVEAAERPAGALFPLSCEHIRYEGVPKRAWPGRAQNR
ncbi:citrate/2-methylcitrate synthase [Roseateles sp. NT4]|uniref:citrate/2-methylcitrate synthase n=1 Tax=Roseateles sp. NT4 TaxID=3453715 RepID=UPI003EF079D5